MKIENLNNMTQYDENNSNVIDSVIKINDFLYYNDEFKIIICSKCSYCLNDSNYESYFKNVQHKDLSIETRRSIVNQLNAIDTLDAKDVRVLEANQHLFPYLNIYDDDFRCHLCSYLVRSEKKIRNHMNFEHKIKYKGKKDTRDYDSNLYVQIFFRDVFKNYFVVSIKKETCEEQQNSLTIQQIDSNYTR